jgi:hypothetical protein
MSPARKLASGLLLFTGIAHVLYTLVGGEAGGGVAAALAGVVYLGIGLALRRPDVWPLWLGALLPALGGLGGTQLVLTRFDAVLLLFVVIDVVVVACCVYELATRHRRAA